MDPDPAALLKSARERSGLTQSEVADRAGVHHTMISAYERRRRKPTLATLVRLLEAAGSEMSVELTAAGSGLDARVERSLALAPQARSRRLGAFVRSIVGLFGDFRFAIDGLAAAAVHGVPVEPGRPQVLLADERGAPEALEAVLRSRGVGTWIDDLDRFSAQVPLSGPAMRLANPSRWAAPWIDEFQILVCPAERLDGVRVVPFDDIEVPVVGLWDLEIADPEVAQLLARTRELLARGEAG